MIIKLASYMNSITCTKDLILINSPMKKIEIEKHSNYYLVSDKFRSHISKKEDSYIRGSKLLYQKDSVPKQSEFKSGQVLCLTRVCSLN